MSLDWYPFYARDFRQDTLHLPLAEDAAYRRLIDEYMMSESPLPDNDVALARIIGVPLAEWLLLAPTVRAFFKPEHSHLFHKRCEKELRAQAMLVHSKRTRAKTAAEARWEKYRELKGIHANALPLQSPRNASPMQSDATRQDKTISSLSEPQKKESEEGSRSLATARVDGALTSVTEGAAPPKPTVKPVTQLTKVELDAHYAARRTAKGAA